MANIKITDLDAYADPKSTDVLPAVDVTNDETKKVSIADLMENAGSGTEAAPGIAFDGDPNTGIYRPGADQLAISTAGTQRLLISDTGAVTIPGDLTVQGTTTFIDTETLQVEDKNIEIGKVASPTDLTADGGGVTLLGSTNKTLNWVNSTDSWTSSENIDLASGKTYKINGTDVLSATALGSAVQISSDNIPSGTIVNDDVNASAAIAGTKIDPDFGSQTVETTGVFSAAGGAQATPSITFTGDLNTGIYSPGADQVAISTGGTGRLFVDASGRIVSETAGIVDTDRFSTSNRIAYFRTSLNAGNQFGQIAIKGFHGAGINFLRGGTGGETNSAGIFSDASDNLLFTSGGATERLRITSDGKVGVGTSSPNSALDINGIITVRNSGAVRGLIGAVAGDPNYIGLQNGALADSFANSAINQNTTGFTTVNAATGQQLALRIGNGDAIRIDSSKRVGIGTTSPLTPLQVKSATDINLGISGSSGRASISCYNDAGSANIALQIVSSETKFVIGNTDAAVIDSSGRLLVGTSTAPTDSTFVVKSVYGANQPANIYFTSYDTAPSSAGSLGIIKFSDSGQTTAGQIQCTRDGGTWTSGSSQPTRLVFSTTADGASSPTERMRIDSSGRVGIGTTSPESFDSQANNLVVGTGSGHEGLTIYAGTTSKSSVYFADGTSGSALYRGIVGYDHNTDSLQFTSGANLRATIDSSGRLGLGTSSVLGNMDIAGDDPVVYIRDTKNTTYSGGESFGRLAWYTNDTSGIGAHETAYIKNVNSDISTTPTPTLRFGVAGNNAAPVDRMTLTSTGLGIGTSSPARPLDIVSDSGARAIQVRGRSSDNIGLIDFYSNDGATRYASIGAPAAGQFAIETGNTERLRIDSSGRLLVGTSTSVVSYSDWPLQVLGQTAVGTFIGANTFAYSQFFIKSRSSSVGTYTIVASGDRLGGVKFNGDDGTDYETTAASIEAFVDGTPGANDMPGRLVFSTTADGAASPTERMRISNLGNSNVFSSAGASGFAARLAEGAGTTYTGLRVLHSATGTTNGTESFKVLSNGNVQNTNNSYGAISDIKLKENIVDASSQWDDLKAIQVRNYNFKEGQTHTQLGVVAQEVELVSPGLVSESPDRDEDGNDLGTVTKSVNYSVLYMKAVKALQEAMERIEVLEAKVNALEGN